MNIATSPNRLNQIIFFLAALALSACGNSKHIEETKVQPAIEKTPEKSNSIIWVNSYRSDCAQFPPVNYYFLTQEGTEKPNGNWDCLYEEIDGFEYEVGHIYQIEVEKIMHEGKPALKHIKTISNERDSDYYRIYDMWALTHLNQAVLEISEARPTIEINLNTMKIMGTAICNQYFSKIEAYSPTLINFGPIGSTKMMCPNIEMEDAFIAALKQTDSFKIKELTLYFLNENDEEILRFQKID